MDLQILKFFNKIYREILDEIKKGENGALGLLTKTSFGVLIIIILAIFLLSFLIDWEIPVAIIILCFIYEGASALRSKKSKRNKK